MTCPEAVKTLLSIDSDASLMAATIAHQLVADILAMRAKSVSQVVPIRNPVELLGQRILVPGLGMGTVEAVVYAVWTDGVLPWATVVLDTGRFKEYPLDAIAKACEL